MTIVGLGLTIPKVRLWCTIAGPVLCPGSTRPPGPSSSAAAWTRHHPSPTVRRCARRWAAALSLAFATLCCTVPQAAALSLSLSSNTLTEGSDGVTATVRITDGTTFDTDQKVKLRWGGERLRWNERLVRDWGGFSTITIAAGESSGSLLLSPAHRLGYTVPRRGR